MPSNIKGRGSAENPANRFESTRFERDPESIDPDDPEPSPLTVLIPDRTRTIIATNDSPDVGFDASINPYRGCEHGCAYCYARPGHEYLGLSAGLDFETKIHVKHDAPALLRRELMKPGWVPQVIAMSGVTDAYQPAERKLRITRGCLEVLAEFRNPVAIITKSRLVARDADILGEMARVRRGGRVRLGDEPRCRPGPSAGAEGIVADGEARGDRRARQGRRARGRGRRAGRSRA